MRAFFTFTIRFRGHFWVAMLLSFCATVHGNAQLKSELDTARVVELEALQTPANTLISASMQRIYLSPTHRKERILIHRSTDLGASYVLIDSIEGQNNVVDPVLAIDAQNRIYLVTMHLRQDSIIRVDLELHRSTDDGLTWSQLPSPHFMNGIADYPQLLAQGDGQLYLCYSHFQFAGSGGLAGQVAFKRSFDGGLNWTPMTTFSLPNGNNPAGPDLSITHSEGLLLSYGTSSLNEIYVHQSIDSGSSWSSPEVLSNGLVSDSFNISKPILHPNFQFQGLLSHQPHQSHSPIHFFQRGSSSQTWTHQLLANGAYAQGLIDDLGRVHVVYNQKAGSNFRIQYIQSADSGTSFGPPTTLYSAPFGKAEAGEYQSFILGNDGFFYLTFCDWSDASKAKLLVFHPTTLGLPQLNATRFKAYPNPSEGQISIELPTGWQPTLLRVMSLQGKIVWETQLYGKRVKDMNLGHLPAGTYLLRLEEAHRSLLQQVVHY